METAEVRKTARGNAIISKISIGQAIAVEANQACFPVEQAGPDNFTIGKWRNIEQGARLGRVQEGNTIAKIGVRISARMQLQNAGVGSQIGACAFAALVPRWRRSGDDDQSLAARSAADSSWTETPSFDIGQSHR